MENEFVLHGFLRMGTDSDRFWRIMEDLKF